MKYYGIQNEVKSYINRLQDENGIFVSTSDIKTINDRVESLKRSGDWSRFSLGFNDVDGDAYLARAGVTNPLGRCEVLWFTRGMKALNLWNSMLCWSMRNYQNAGTGATVFSLGGLGVFNGTTINSPTWGNNGITFTNANTQYMTTAYNTVLNNFSFISPCSISNLGITRYIAGQVAFTGSRAWDFNIQTTANTFTQFGIESTRTSPDYFFNVNIATNTPRYMAVTRAPTLLSQIHNGIQTTNVAVAYSNLNTSQLVIGASSFGTRNNAFDGTMYAATYFNTDLSFAQHESVRSLYKSTLGNGLGLP